MPRNIDTNSVFYPYRSISEYMNEIRAHGVISAQMLQELGVKFANTVVSYVLADLSHLNKVPNRNISAGLFFDLMKQTLDPSRGDVICVGPLGTLDPRGGRLRMLENAQMEGAAVKERNRLLGEWFPAISQEERDMTVVVFSPHIPDGQFVLETHLHQSAVTGRGNGRRLGGIAETEYGFYTVAGGKVEPIGPMRWITYADGRTGEAVTGFYQDSLTSSHFSQETPWNAAIEDQWKILYVSRLP